MKFLSNFDTELAKSLQREYSEIFGEEKVVLVRKSTFYFYKHIGRPFFIFLVLLIVGSYTLYSYGDVRVEVELIFWAIFLMYFLLLLTKVSGRRIDYRMDFLVVTPKEVIKYNQSGAFHRDTENIGTDHIKSISVRKHGIVKSFLNIGEIVFLAESHREEGDIMIDYVDAVSHTERRIREVMGLNSK